MLKTLLGLLVGLFTAGCGWGQSPKDKFFWTRKHISFIEQQPIWKNSEAEVYAYFGFDYRNFNDTFQEYHGDPLGPVAGIWEITQYFGNKPKFRECGKKPAWNPNGYKSSSQEYIDSEKQWDIETKKRKECININNDLKEKSKTIKYYYARSTDNYKPVILPRVEDHALYEAHLSFGPLGGIPLDKLSKEHQVIKDQLQRWYCLGSINNAGDKGCYRLPGEESSIYYKVRSLLKAPKNKDGMASAPWESPDPIHYSPDNWQEVKGIEINKAQYDYLYEKYKQSPTKPIVFRLDNNAPDLNEKQKAYIKATTWEADSNEQAYDNLLKAFYK